MASTASEQHKKKCEQQTPDEDHDDDVEKL